VRYWGEIVTSKTGIGGTITVMVQANSVKSSLSPSKPHTVVYVFTGAFDGAAGLAVSVSVVDDVAETGSKEELTPVGT
jgi:hypothetical protein